MDKVDILPGDKPNYAVALYTDERNDQTEYERKNEVYGIGYEPGGKNCWEFIWGEKPQKVIEFAWWTGIPGLRWIMEYVFDKIPMKVSYHGGATFSARRLIMYDKRTKKILLQRDFGGVCAVTNGVLTLHLPSTEVTMNV